jgi:multidrug resistance efflux pump
MAEHETQNHETSAATNNAKNKKSKKIIPLIIGLVVLIVIAAIGAYFYVASKTVSIDTSMISAPLINLSPVNSGVLEQILVNVGDEVPANTPVARVGNEIVETKTAGEIVSINQNIGSYLNAVTGQATVATMVDPTQLRVVGSLDENKGLSSVQVGDAATFTVDAFGGKKYQGVVDEVSPTSNQSDVVFNISDARPTNEFSVYVRFDPTLYPELKNGMSARISIYKQ